MRTSLTSAVLGLSFLCTSCGGAVQFAPLHQKVITPPVVQSDPSITETFSYGRSIGATFIVFLFYPRKTMEPVFNQFQLSSSEFIDRFWRTADHYETIQIAVQRDAYGAVSNLFNPIQFGLERPQWKNAMGVFLKNTVAAFSPDLQSGESYSLHPYTTMSNLLRTISQDSYQVEALSKMPVWVHFVYFRDWDISPPDVGTRSGYEEANQVFLQNLAQKPFSPYRYSVSLVSHLTMADPCLPASRISTNLVGTFGSLGSSFTKLEICPLLNGNPQWQSSVINTIADQDHQMILGKKPVQSTLQVRAGGVSIPREKIRFDAAKNKIDFIDAVAQTLSIGDLIEVNYVPE